MQCCCSALGEVTHGSRNAWGAGCPPEREAGANSPQGMRSLCSTQGSGCFCCRAEKFFSSSVTASYTAVRGLGVQPLMLDASIHFEMGMEVKEGGKSITSYSSTPAFGLSLLSIPPYPSGLVSMDFNQLQRGTLKSSLALLSPCGQPELGVSFIQEGTPGTPLRSERDVSSWTSQHNRGGI